MSDIESLLGGGDFHEYPAVYPEAEPPGNTPPVADDQDLEGCDAGEGIPLTLSASDADLDTLTYTIDTPPTHGDLTGVAPDLVYTPDPGYVGPDSFDWHANDGTDDSNVATYTLTITECVEGCLYTDTFDATLDGSWEPFFSNPGAGYVWGTTGGVATVTTGTPGLSGAALNRDMGWRNGTLTVTLGPLLDGWEITIAGALLITGGSYAEFVLFTVLGTDATIRVRSGLGDVTYTATLGAPLAEGDTVALSVNCSQVVGRVNGTIVVDETSETTGAVGDNHLWGFGFGNTVGTDLDAFPEFDTAAFVCDPRHSPVAVDQTLAACDEGAGIALQLDATDVDGDPLTYIIDTPPTHGDLDAGDGTGGYIYTPDPDYLGPDSFDWHADDGTGCRSATVTFTLTVTPCPTVPIVPRVQLPQLGQCDDVTITLHHGSGRAFATLSTGRSQVSSYEWGRTRNAISDARIVIPLGGNVTEACCDELANVVGWRDTMRIWRGQADAEEVWRGPVRTPIYENDQITISARDGARWLERRRVRTDRDVEKVDAATVWALVAQDALAADWPPLFKVTAGTAGMRISRQVRALPWKYAASELSDIAGDLVDWSVICGDLRIGSALRTGAPRVQLDDNHFVGSLQIARDADAYASWYGITAGNGITAATGGTDPSLGLVEVFDDERDITDQPTAAAHASAGWYVRGGNSVPLVVASSDVAFSPAAPVTPERLVPGRVFELRVGPSCLQVMAQLRLASVRVTGDAEKETITPTFEPLDEQGAT